MEPVVGEVAEDVQEHQEVDDLYLEDRSPTPTPLPPDIPQYNSVHVAAPLQNHKKPLPIPRSYLPMLGKPPKAVKLTVPMKEGDSTTMTTIFIPETANFMIPKSAVDSRKDKSQTPRGPHIKRSPKATIALAVHRLKATGRFTNEQLGDIFDRGSKWSYNILKTTSSLTGEYRNQQSIAR